jgi:DNA-binding NtrC family response regulator
VAATWARIFDASRGLVVSYTVMDVLIVEPDELIGTVLADALDQDGLTATLVPDEQKAFDLPPHDAPRVVITGMNRGNNEDMAGLHIARALRRKWPGIAVIYMAALWPVRLHRCALAVRERFLAKPVPLAKMIRTVRELLAADMRRQAG